MQKWLEKLIVSKSSDDIDDSIDWTEQQSTLGNTNSLVWLLQENLNLTNILDLTVTTPRSTPTSVKETLNNPLFVISSPSKDLLNQVQELYHLLDVYDIEYDYSSDTKRMNWTAYHSGYDLDASTPPTESGSIDIEEVIPLSISDIDRTDCLDHQWHATFIKMKIKYNNVTIEHPLIILHAAHTAVAPLFTDVSPMGVVLNKLTKNSAPSPYQKEGPLLSAVTSMKPSFVAIDTPDFVYQHEHSVGVVQWYTVTDKTWTLVSK